MADPIVNNARDGPSPEPSAVATIAPPSQSSSPRPPAPPAISTSSRPASLAAPSSPMAAAAATHSAALFPSDDIEPDQPPRPFDPPLALITNTATGTTHHPRVYYIFEDDEPDAIQHALSLANTRNNCFYDRAVIVDLQPSDTPTGWTVASASSMTADWAVTSASFTPLGGGGGSPDHTALVNPAAAAAAAPRAPGSGSDTEGDLVLQIDGTDALPPARTVAIPVAALPADAQASNALLEPGAKAYDALMNEFAARMAALERVVETGKANMQRTAYIQMPPGSQHDYEHETEHPHEVGAYGQGDGEVEAHQPEPRRDIV